MAGLVIDIKGAVEGICVLHGVVDHAVTVRPVVSVHLDGTLTTKIQLYTNTVSK